VFTDRKGRDHHVRYGPRPVLPDGPEPDKTYSDPSERDGIPVLMGTEFVIEVLVRNGQDRGVRIGI